MKPLSVCDKNETVAVRQVRGGRGIRMRMAGLGIHVGDKITVVSKIPRGPMVIEFAALGNRVAIGWGMANKILVE